MTSAQPDSARSKGLPTVMEPNILEGIARFLLGTGWPDLSSYALVREMRSVPFGLEDIARLAAATAAPRLASPAHDFLPGELIMPVIKVVF